MQDDVEEIKRRVNLVDLVQSYVPLRKAGASWRGLCPFHQEKTPSFHVNEERQIFKCFGCSEAGDAIDWLMKMEHLTFPEALQLLADRVGVILDKRKTPAQYREEKDEKSRLYRLNRLSAEVFHKILKEHPKAASARAYLAERGISDETMRTFQIGYAPVAARGGPTVLEQFLTQRGFTPTERKRAGSPDRFAHRLIFPLWDVLGNPIGFTGRALDPNDQPKYLNTPETPLFKKSRVLYPLDRAKEAIKTQGRAILVEGQLDVLLAHQLGSSETVATSGTALTTEHLEIIRRYTSRVVFAFDADPAGIEATRKAILLAYDLELEPSVLRLPVGVKDIGELAVAQPEAWSTILAAILPAVLWQLETAHETIAEADSATGKKAIGKLVIPILARIRDPIERAHWIQLVARRLAVPERTIHETISRHLGGAQTVQTRSAEPARVVASERLGPEEVLLGLLVMFPGHLTTLAVRLEEADFPANTPSQRLAKAIGSWYTQTSPSQPTQPELLAVLKTSLEATDAKWLDQLLLQIDQLHGESDSPTVSEEIRAGFERLRQRRQETIKETVAREIADAEQGGDRQTVQDLLKKLQTLLK